MNTFDFSVFISQDGSIRKFVPHILKKFEKAKFFLKIAVDIEPFNLWSNFELGLAHLALGEKDESLDN